MLQLAMLGDGQCPCMQTNFLQPYHPINIAAALEHAH